jgi:outer membrane protein assembly factor BamB
MVYVPTDQGLLFAIRAADRSPAWAACYRRDEPGRWRGPAREPAYWLSTPPVVSGSVVLLAPSDSDSLFAFDRFSGELRWSVDREQHRYIVAASREHVWVAGREVVCLSARTGETKWVTGLPEPTGRAAVSGTQIYVPTVDGLVALDASTGSVVSNTPMPPGHAPLGNLLALADSLISVDAYEVRKYPDLDGGYARAVVACEADPGDAAVAIRLAWMELLRDAPQRALDVLAPFEPSGALANHPRREQAVHLRVEALTAISRQPDVSVDEAARTLAQAKEEAQLRQDVLRAGLTLGHQLEQSGRFAEAYSRLWELGRSEAGRLTVTTEDGVRRQARAAIRELLGRLENKLSTTDRARLADEADEFVATATVNLGDPSEQEQARQHLRAIAQTGAPDGWDQAALIELARWEALHRRYERAEQDYLAVVRLDRSPKQTARALLGLAEMYLRPEQSLVVAAEACLDRLEQEYALLEVDDVPGAETAGSTPVARQVERLRRLIVPARAARHRAALDPPAFRLVGESAWSEDLQGGRARLVHFVAGRPEALVNSFVVATRGTVLRGHEVGNGGLAWEAELRLPNRFRHHEVFDWAEVSSDDQRYAVADGQTLLMTTVSGLHAVGMVSGKRLWAVPRSAEPQASSEALVDAAVAASQGLVAWLPRPGRLAVMTIRDGSAMWERDVEGLASGGSAGGIRIVDDFVLVTNALRTRVEVFRLQDGQRRTTLRFQPPDGEGPLLGLCCQGGLLCGSEGSTVVAYEVATGERRWRLATPGGLASLFELGDEQIGVGSATGMLRVVDSATGSVVREVALEECDRGVVDGTLDSNVLVVGGAAETSSGPRWVLVGLEASTADVLWIRDDLAGVSVKPWFFGVAQGVVAVMVDMRSRSTSPGRYGTGPRAGLAVLDVLTGTELGPPVVADGGRSSQYLTGDVAAWPGCLVVGTSKGVNGFQTEPFGREIE